GITDLASAQVAIEAGADSIGFVLAPSVRQITASRAATIAAELAESVEKVAVFRGPRSQEITRALEVFDVDVVQADFRSLVGLQSPRLLPVFREKLATRETIVVEAEGGRFVYEGARSGEGRTVNWHLASDMAQLGQMTLAGGLDPHNVAEAIRIVRPFGVDVSSGVESSPGVKDPARIRAFVEAVREAEKDLVKP
ncbi:MAG: phosphoribosylanthranilate isomerase, partial [Acidimicrobiia bacterium]|nr:phosphoribosylanthranilate isomerase [Acidimicrobiia bacterium]